MRLSLTDPRMPIRCAFYPAVQCQTSRDMNFGKKGVCQNMTRIISNINIYVCIICDINIFKVKIHDNKPKD